MKISIDTVRDSKEEIKKVIVLLQSIIQEPQMSTEITPSSDFTPMPTSTDILNDIEKNPVQDEPDKESKEEENLGFMTY